jgi:argininosuccinate synthase
VGIKSRGVYETPAGTILMAAHRDLEGLCLDREVMHLRDSLIPKFAELVYYGFWYSPEMEVLRTFFDKTQEYVTGKVKLALYKGNIIMAGRESPFSLYDQAQSSMEVARGFDPKNSIGFIKPRPFA